MVMAAALIAPALLPTLASAQDRHHDDQRKDDHRGDKQRGDDRNRNRDLDRRNRDDADRQRRFADDGRRQVDRDRERIARDRDHRNGNHRNWDDRGYDHRQNTKNTWSNLGLLGGAAGVYGLITGNKTVAALGLGGGLYSLYRYDQDRKSQDRDSRGRYELFRHSSFDHNGHHYERRTVNRGGQRYYTFARIR